MRPYPKFCKLTILQCYAPTNEAKEEDKEDWHEQLQMVVSKAPQHDMLLIIGDMNAEVETKNFQKQESNGQAWIWRNKQQW